MFIRIRAILVSPLEQISIFVGRRVGGLVAIAQAAPTASGESVAALGDVYGQTKRRLQIVLLQYAV